MPALRRGANIGRRTARSRQYINCVQNQSELRDPTGTFNADSALALQFQDILDKKSYCTCTICLRTEYVDTRNNFICNSCSKDPIKYTVANNMLPGQVPPELRNLTMVEQLFIARVHPVMRIYQVRASGSTGQYHYSGHIINVAQDIIQPARSIPLATAELGIVIVRRAGMNGFTDFRVRKQVVLRALHYLQTTNPWYADVEIDDWRANTDCKIIASEHAIINYLSKYAAKGEPQSQNYRDVFLEILRASNQDDPSRKAISKLLMKIIGQRDVSACEVMRLITGEPLKQCSRTFATIYIGLDDYTLVTTDIDEGDQLIPRSLIERYASRQSSLESMCLKEFAIEYHWSKGQIRKCRYKRILQVLPSVTASGNDTQVEIYFKQKLALNKPWRDMEALKTHLTWKESFQATTIQVWEINEHDLESIEQEDIDTIENEPSDDLALAAALPNLLPSEVSLGYRDIDRMHNWFESFDKYDNIEGSLKLIKTSKETYESTTRVDTTIHAPMNNGQQKVMQHLEKQLQNDTNQKLTIIQGAAGTGKSFLINQMVRKIESSYGEGSVLLLAPTGVSANNINGHTLHSALRLNLTRGEVPDLQGESERQFQETMSTVKVCLLDEMSMVGSRCLANIDRRLRQAFPSTQDEPFGGTILYLLGDFAQLPPVLDRTLLAPDVATNATSAIGRLLFEQFTKVFILTEVMRQAGDEQRNFRETLNRMAIGELNQTDYDLLKTRFSVNLGASASNFNDAIRIFSKKTEVKTYNLEMRSLNTPVTIIRAKNNNATAERCSDDEAHGLANHLQLAKGSRVMLKTNLWTEQGLCNGSLGYVEDIVYKPRNEGSHLDDTPLCILVRFDKYTGPTLYNGVVPIEAQIAGFRKGSVSCTRKQFPLQVAYAITVHKSQGITVDKAVIDIGTSEFALGLSYVGISRVRTLQGLMIDPAFPPDRLFKSINQNSSRSVKKNEMERLRLLSNNR